MQSGDAPSILIIEDDADTRDNLRDILELDGFRIEEAATVAEALDRENWSTYATILLDRKLPDGTAADLLPHLKRLAPTADVIVLTGYADVEGAISALRMGAADYLLKPINPDGFAGADRSPRRAPASGGGTAAAIAHPSIRAEAGRRRGDRG